MKELPSNSVQKGNLLRLARRLSFKFHLARQNLIALVSDSPPREDLFDGDFYLAQYSDVAQAGIDPYEHFILYGRKEGRIGVPAYLPKLEYRGNLEAINHDRDTILVVSHEASRTGAPILSLNIVRELKKKYNVITLLLLNGGVIADDFLRASDIVIGPFSDGRNPDLVASGIDQLLALTPVTFAIVNSIESRAVLPGLARRFIPTVSLIHEFASYVRPVGSFREVVFWSSETIFSASLTYENAISEYPDLRNCKFPVVPQGRCALPSPENEAALRLEEEAKVLAMLRPVDLPKDTVIILGAGTVEIRKGVDLFIACAAEIFKACPDALCRFVWIGSGYDPEHDGAYSVYLADQIRRSGLQERVFFLPATSSIETAYQAADIFLLSPRLDPLPNVAIDAMWHGLPVVCFARATGIADILIENGFEKICVARYFEISQLASKILALIKSRPMRQEIGRKLQQLVLNKFNIEHYVSQLEGIGFNAGKRVVNEQADILEIIKSGISRLDFYVPPWLEGQQLDEAVRFYVRAWRSGVLRRKLFPGFHPGVFLEHNAGKSEGDPLANYLRAGQPDGPWRYGLITSEEAARPLSSSIRVALHLHVYYSELFPEIMARLKVNNVRPDLFISVPTECTRNEVTGLLNDYPGKVVDIQIVPNRGRDIGPLLTAFGSVFLDDYDAIGHLHTKKTADLSDEMIGKRWYTFLLENLLGGKRNMADIILGRMTADPAIGIVFPDDPHVFDWGNNKAHADSLASKLGLGKLQENFVFPMGTMFWARTEALRPLFTLDLSWQDYPAEPLPYDGTILHALERLLPLIAAKQSTRSVLTNVTGVTR
ncbi:Glycosyl transferases group 1 [Nitrosospira multiformis ATCC 25196]|uniref:Glycosyl transferase, group 1 n=1 Tax=Nitrosospira multiformis (strain ATCC 25196 / NCIMB 11849 / C 71) TaxID=323848 RepID=Q2Y6C9_NITMU|nr:rhamnan synthesis F family protein [Nitrosospira multiformis]ABB75692.1 Glycosyl transferase, group 1 [Nitrosospira multiformis ATCC 25196]SEG17692.1 Glycosyl transferases group 1 [Nitrosospira multiformis ATCC 25196]